MWKETTVEKVAANGEWNETRIEQVTGRVVRDTSHSYLLRVNSNEKPEKP